MPKAFPQEFRRDVVAVVRRREAVQKHASRSGIRRDRRRSQGRFCCVVQLRHWRRNCGRDSDRALASRDGAKLRSSSSLTYVPSRLSWTVSTLLLIIELLASCETNRLYSFIALYRDSDGVIKYPR
jgi:hypothetical protein